MSVRSIKILAPTSPRFTPSERATCLSFVSAGRRAKTSGARSSSHQPLLTHAGIRSFSRRRCGKGARNPVRSACQPYLPSKITGLLLDGFDSSLNSPPEPSISVLASPGFPPFEASASSTTNPCFKRFCLSCPTALRTFDKTFATVKSLAVCCRAACKAAPE